MVAGIAALGKLFALILAATAISGPILDAQLAARAASFQIPQADASGRHRQQYQRSQQLQQQQQQQQFAQAIRNPLQLVDCELVAAADGRPEALERCLATIELALRSSYGLDMDRIRSTAEPALPIEGLAYFGRQGPSAGGQQQLQKSRRDPRSPALANTNHRASPYFVPAGQSMAGQSHEALNKLLMSGLAGSDGSGGGGADEFSVLDANDKPIWAGSMSDEIQSRWQPMRGKRF
jgi:hypothetical protein